VGCSPSLILDFSASINPLGPPLSAIAAIQAHLNTLRDYPDPDYWHLRSALAEHHNVPPEWVLVGNGSAELLTWACRELAELETTCVITPAFGDYYRALKAFAASVLPVKMGDWGAAATSAHPLTDLGSLQSAISDLNAQSIGLLLNNPHNPTGYLIAKETVLALLERFALVVIDEAFMDFLRPEQDQSVLPWVMQYPNLVVLRSLTKFYSLPGLRIGYAIAHPDRLRRWQQWRDPWSVNSLAAAAAVAVVQDTTFQEQTWQWLEPARSHLSKGLSQLPGIFPVPSVANFVLVRSASSAVTMQQRLLHRDRILIRDCVSFLELGDRYFRVAIRTEAEHDRLLAGLAAALE
jgi:L-threonine-O-3-phosphate decarboxylase